MTGDEQEGSHPGTKIDCPLEKHLGQPLTGRTRRPTAGPELKRMSEGGMLMLEVRTMELGEDVRAVGLELRAEEDAAASGAESAAVWARVLPALAGDEPWAIDFFSHLNRVREFCARHGIAAPEEHGRALVIAELARDQLEELIARFEGETFGARAGERLEDGDAELERELVHRGLDAYHHAYSRYLFCGVCEFAEGSLVVLSEPLDAGEILRRAKEAVEGMEVEVFQSE